MDEKWRNFSNLTFRFPFAISLSYYMISRIQEAGYILIEDVNLSSTKYRAFLGGQNLLGWFCPKQVWWRHLRFHKWTDQTNPKTSRMYYIHQCWHVVETVFKKSIYDSASIHHVYLVSIPFSQFQSVFGWLSFWRLDCVGYHPSECLTRKTGPPYKPGLEICWS